MEMKKLLVLALLCVLVSCSDDEPATNDVIETRSCIGNTEEMRVLWTVVRESDPLYFKGNCLQVWRVLREFCQQFVNLLNQSKGGEPCGGDDVNRAGLCDINNEGGILQGDVESANESGLYDVSGNVHFQPMVLTVFIIAVAVMVVI